jgi:hypothetical protein
VLQLAAAGVIGVVIWKVLSILLLPLLGTFLGVLFMIVKVALVVGLIVLAFWFLKRNGGTGKTELGGTDETGEATAE